MDGETLCDVTHSHTVDKEHSSDDTSTKENLALEQVREDLEKTLPAGSSTDKSSIDRSSTDRFAPPESKQELPYISNDSPAQGQRMNARHGEKNALNVQGTKAGALKTAGDEVIHSLVGTVLDNQYQIMSLIGQGGMSVVYKARHNMLRKIVAIKTMLPHLMQHPMALQRFQQEAQAASNIGHTNVITIYNFGITPEGQPYLVMDYLEGKSIGDVIARDGFLSVERATNIFLQVANALAHAHNKGVIHRDLKPSNIILIEQGEKKDVVQIVDFGIAKMLPQDGEVEAALTQTGEIFGSPLYMSPEQCKGEKLDMRADIYSMGCLMYETLTGRPPLIGDNTLEVLYKHINEMPASMSSKEHPIPPRLEAIVFKALAKLPSNRYQTMSQLEQELLSFQKAQQFSIISFFKSRWELARAKRLPQTKREKAANAAIMLAALAIVMLGVYPSIVFWNLPSDPIVRTPLALDDDRRPLSQDRHELDIKGWEMAKAQSQEFLLGKPVNEGPSKLYGALMNQGKYHSSIGRFDIALEAFDSATRFSEKVNGAQAIPTMQALLERADVEYNIGTWQAAAHSYEKFLQYISSNHRESERVAYYCARLGNCYWNLQNYDAAKINYNRAIKIWSHPYTVPARDGILGNYAVSKDDAFSFALAKTRLAMIFDRELKNKNIADLLPDDYKASIAKEAPVLLYTALPVWRQVLPPESKNEGICELELAGAIARQPDIELNRKSTTNDTEVFATDDSNVEKLFENGIRAIGKSCGESDLYYAIGLLRSADYRWKNRQFYSAIAERGSACEILRRLDSAKAHHG